VCVCVCVWDSAAKLIRVFLCVIMNANANINVCKHERGCGWGQCCQADTCVFCVRVIVNANLNLNLRECECVCAFGTVLLGLIGGAPSGAHLEELGTTFLTALLHESHGAPCKRVS